MIFKHESNHVKSTKTQETGSKSQNPLPAAWSETQKAENAKCAQHAVSDLSSRHATELVGRGRGGNRTL